jgi:hypothetical protein
MKSRVIFHRGRNYNRSGHTFINKAIKIIDGVFDAGEADLLGYNLFYNLNDEPFDLPQNDEAWQGINPRDIKLLDSCGDEVCDYEDVLADMGSMNFDGDYDTIYWVTFDKLDRNDLVIIFNTLKPYEYYNDFVKSNVFDEKVLDILFKGGDDINSTPEDCASMLYDNSFEDLINKRFVEEKDNDSNEYFVTYKNKKYQLCR